MPIFRATFPDRVKQKRSFKLEDLHKDLLDDDHECANQKELMIKEIFDECAIGVDDLEDYTPSWYDATMQYHDNEYKAECRESLTTIFGDVEELQPLIKKMGEYRFHLDNLVETYQKRGRAALLKELSEKNPLYGNPPVTTDQQLLKIMADKIAKYCAKK